MERLLLGVEAISFLEKEGFPALRTALAQRPEEAASIASMIGFPVALKVSSREIIHKTEERGVKLFLNSGEEVRAAYRDLALEFAARRSGKSFDGVMVQHMASGLELIVGCLSDNQFGPVLMFGLGGIFAEAMNDVSFRTIPINTRDAGEMIRELRASTVLTKPRGETIDLFALEHFLLRVSHLVAAHREIQEMDLNPLFASSRGLEICDARIKLNVQGS